MYISLALCICVSHSLDKSNGIYISAKLVLTNAIVLSITLYICQLVLTNAIEVLKNAIELSLYVVHLLGTLHMFYIPMTKVIKYALTSYIYVCTLKIQYEMISSTLRLTFAHSKCIWKRYRLGYDIVFAFMHLPLLIVNTLSNNILKILYMNLRLCIINALWLQLLIRLIKVYMGKNTWIFLPTVVLHKCSIKR